VAVDDFDVGGLVRRASRHRAPVARWAAVVASAYGPTHPQVRAVLLALSTFMNGSGETFASHRALADASAIGPRRCRWAIREAETAGWLASTVAGRTRGRAWRLKGYRIRFPGFLAASVRGEAPGASPQTIEGSHRQAGREAGRASRGAREVRFSGARGEAQRCHEVRLGVPGISLTGEISQNSAPARSGDEGGTPRAEGRLDEEARWAVLRSRATAINFRPPRAGEGLFAYSTLLLLAEGRRQ
jgi:hypothetical protein